jgi:predicted AAA+ superfamily ATPase
LIFIDEIQSQPRAITALRYFYEDYPNIALISAGSLLEIVLNKEKDISFQVGRVEFYYLGPMQFSEFINASNNSLLKKELSRPSKIQNSDALHEHFCENYKKFLAVGGMPEAVKTYYQSEKLINVQNVHRSIIETYKSDFPKYGLKVKIDRLDKIFSAVPYLVGQKLKYANIDRDLKARDVKNGLELLELAKVISSCVHSNCSGHPIESQTDSSVRKLFYLDIGLWNYAMKTNLQSIIDNKSLF